MILRNFYVFIGSLDTFFVKCLFKAFAPFLIELSV